MKRLLLLLAIACVGLASCSETLSEDGENGPNEVIGGSGDKEYAVKFKVDMRVPELNEEVKNSESEFLVSCVKFYTDLIESRLVVPNDYALTFTKDGEVVGEYKGTWGETEITLSNGTYRVTGESIGDFNMASFSFDQEVVIDKITTRISLIPKFKSALFIFNKKDFVNVWWCNGGILSELTYLNTDNIFYMFMSNYPYQSVIISNLTFCDEMKNADWDNIPKHWSVIYVDEEKNKEEKAWVYPGFELDKSVVLITSNKIVNKPFYDFLIE